MHFSLATLWVLATGFMAVHAKPFRDVDDQICDHYTREMFVEGSTENQFKLIKLWINTAMAGNYSNHNTGIYVPGALTGPTVHTGVAVNLLPYFDGTYLSTNIGMPTGQSVNFLDGGGLAALREGMPAYNEGVQDDMFSSFYIYFGNLLGCSGLQTRDYAGITSMYEAHKFMYLSLPELSYFVSQLALAAESIGFNREDVDIITTSLLQMFGQRCSPTLDALEGQRPAKQAICTDESEEGKCPVYQNGKYCGLYKESKKVGRPKVVSGRRADLGVLTKAPALSTAAVSQVIAGVTRT